MVTYRVEAALGIPDPLGEFGILQQRIRAGGVIRAHAHVHTTKGEDSSQSLGAEVHRRPTIDGLERMHRQHIPDEAGSEEMEERRKVLPQDVGDADLVVPMGLLKEGEVAFEAILALPFLDLDFHASQVGGQLDRGAIVEPEVIVGLAFNKPHPLPFQAGAQVSKGVDEEIG